MNAQLTEGVYNVVNGVYRVQKSKNGYLYAKKLNLKTGSWSYEDAVADKAMKNLRPETKVSVEFAKAYGLKTGKCMICGRTLTNKNSVEAGIGPICAGAF